MLGFPTPGTILGPQSLGGSQRTWDLVMNTLLLQKRALCPLSSLSPGLEAFGGNQGEIFKLDSVSLFPLLFWDS
jgi:hypothetical protein